MPRINFVSLTFLVAFGLGSFTGIGLALLAVAVATPEAETKLITPEAGLVADSFTVTPTATATVTATPLPVPTTDVTLQVRIGPNEDYAILGTLASGSAIEVEGRDSLGEWLAIEFPPGSAARGWIPAGNVSNLSSAQIGELDILQASLIDTTPDFPGPDAETPSALEGNDGLPQDTLPTETPATLTSTPSAATAPAGTPTPLVPTPTPGVAYGPTDLVIAGVDAAGDGSIRIAVENLGPGDVPGASLVVQVVAEGFAPEVLGASGVVRAGETVSFRTTSTLLTERTQVSIVVDPTRVLTDLQRGNNSLSLPLTP